MKDIEFICNNFLSLAHTGNGLLYPLFDRSVDGINAPYVAEIDKNSNIMKFVSFYECENYLIVRSAQTRTAKQGAPCIFAFYDQNKFLNIFTINELKDLYSSDPQRFDSLPILTKLQIVRAIGAKISTQHKFLTEFANKYLPSQVARESYVYGNLRVISDYNKIWYAINQDQQNIPSVKVDLDRFQKMQTSELWIWLTKPDDDKLWASAWLEYARRKSIDDTLYEMAVDRVIRFDTISDISRSDLFLVETVLADFIKDKFSFATNNTDLREFIVESIDNGFIWELANCIDNKLIVKLFKKLYEQYSVDLTDNITTSLNTQVISVEVTAYFLNYLNNIDLDAGTAQSLQNYFRSPKYKLVQGFQEVNIEARDLIENIREKINTR